MDFDFVLLDVLVRIVDVIKVEDCTDGTLETLETLEVALEAVVARFEVEGMDVWEVEEVVDPTRTASTVVDTLAMVAQSQPRVAKEKRKRVKGAW